MYWNWSEKYEVDICCLSYVRFFLYTKEQFYSASVWYHHFINPSVWTWFNEASRDLGALYHFVSETLPEMLIFTLVR